MAKIEGQGPLSSTKQTPWILKVCTHCSDDFCPNVTEIRPVSPMSVLSESILYCIVALTGFISCSPMYRF